MGAMFLGAAGQQAAVGGEREKTVRSKALASLIRAGVAFSRNDEPLARALLTSVAKDFDSIEMRLYAVATRRRLGQLLGGDEGRAMITQADAWMTDQMIKNPVRMTAMLVPGFPDSSNSLDCPRTR